METQSCPKDNYGKREHLMKKVQGPYIFFHSPLLLSKRCLDQHNHADLPTLEKDAIEKIQISEPINILKMNENKSNKLNSCQGSMH